MSLIFAKGGEVKNVARDSFLLRRCYTEQFFLQLNCLAILLQHKLHELLPTVARHEKNRSRNFFLLQQSLQEEEVSSTLCNSEKYHEKSCKAFSFQGMLH